MYNSGVMVTDSAPLTRGRSRRRRLLLILAAVAAVLLIFLGVWLVSPVHLDEPVPGTLKTSDVVEVQAAGQAAPVLVRNLGVVKPGNVVRVGEGKVAFLFLQGGVISRLEGPAQVQLAESRWLIDAPSVLQGLLSQRLGGDPLGRARVRTSLALEVLSGTAAIRAGEVRADASFKLYAANVYSRIQGATVQVTVLPEGEVMWDTLEGEPTVGMVSGPAGDEVAVVVPKAPSGLRLVVPIPPSLPQPSDQYRRLYSSMEAMVDILRREERGLQAGGLEYQEFTDPSGLLYLASVAKEAPETPESFAAHSFEPPPAEEAVAVPGLEVRLLTDADIQALLPAGMTVHMLPGNTLRLTVAGIPYTVRAAVVAGRLELQGLPLGIDPTPYLTEIPALLSLETDEGVARVSYLPEEPPPPPQESGAKEIAQEGALPHSAPYFSTIPTPLQVSWDWDVATSNLLLVALLALVLRVSVTASTNILSAHEATLRRHLDPLLAAWRPIADVLLAFLRRIPHLLTTVAGNALFLLVVNGLMFAFLDVRFEPWQGKGLQVFPLMLLGIAAAGMVDPMVRAGFLGRWKIQHQFGLNPANLLLAASCISVSRGLRLSPGLIVGSAGGLRAPELKNLPLAQKSTLVVAGLVATIVVGLGAWLVTLLLPLAAVNPLSAGLFQLLRGPLSTFQDICLLVFAASLTKVFFTLLPVPNSPGLTVASHSRVGWGAGFLVSGFFFFQLILNKNTGITKLLQERGAILVLLVVLSLAATLALYVYGRVSARKAAAAKT